MVNTEDIYLKSGKCVHYPKSNPCYKGRQFKTHFSELCPFFYLEKTLTFCKISVTTEDIYLKLGVRVNYPKSNPYYQGRQSKSFFCFFSELRPFLHLDILSFFKHLTAECWHAHAVLLF